MKEAFPDYPLLSSIRASRSFSLPQQTYLVLAGLLELYQAEAPRQFEQDHQEQERESMSRQADAERLDASADALRYETILTLFHQAQRHLVDWGIEQLQHDPHTPALVLKVIADKERLWKRPYLLNPLIEICLHLKEHPLLGDDGSQ